MFLWFPVLDLARAPRRTARKKGSGYENDFCRKARSCQSFSASHIDQRDISAFHRPLYKRPVSNITRARANISPRAEDHARKQAHHKLLYIARARDNFSKLRARGTIYIERVGQFLQIARARDNFSKIARARATLGRNCAPEISGARYKLSSLASISVIQFPAATSHS